MIFKSPEMAEMENERKGGLEYMIRRSEKIHEEKLIKVKMEEEELQK